RRRRRRHRRRLRRRLRRRRRRRHRRCYQAAPTAPAEAGLRLSAVSHSRLADLDLVALELADIGDAIALGRFSAADLAVSAKAGGSPASDADRAAAHALRARLAEASPGVPVVGVASAPALGRRWWAPRGAAALALERRRRPDGGSGVSTNGLLHDDSLA